MKIPALFFACILVAAAAGCDRKGAPGGNAAATNQPPQARQRSATKDVIYTMTQYDTIARGRKVKETVKAIDAKHKEDLNEVAEEQP